MSEAQLLLLVLLGCAFCVLVLLRWLRQLEEDIALDLEMDYAAVTVDVAAMATRARVRRGKRDVWAARWRRLKARVTGLVAPGGD